MKITFRTLKCEYSAAIQPGQRIVLSDGIGELAEIFYTLEGNIEMQFLRMEDDGQEVRVPSTARMETLADCTCLKVPGGLCPYHDQGQR